MCPLRANLDKSAKFHDAKGKFVSLNDLVPLASTRMTLTLEIIAANFTSEKKIVTNIQVLSRCPGNIINCA